MFSYTVLLQLQLYQLAGQVYLANVHTTNTFEGNPVALLYDIVSIVAEELLTTAVIERDLNNGVRFGAIRKRKTAEPIKYVKTIATAGTTTAVAFAAIRFATGTRTAIA